MQQAPQPASAAAAAAAAAPRWCKYYAQRIPAEHANFALFYLVGADAAAQLAAVGVDAKRSGHFVYSSVVMEGDTSAGGGHCVPPLRCTNRRDVLAWLAALGASEAAEDHEVRLPALTAAQLAHLATPYDEGAAVRPALDRPYTDWRQDTGVRPDGGHFKRFFLVDPVAGTERLAVQGEDGSRADRRYAYRAVDELGGCCFYNSAAVVEWIKWVVGLSDEPPAWVRRKPAAGGGNDGTQAGGGRLLRSHSDAAAAAAAAAGGGVGRTSLPSFPAGSTLAPQQHHHQLLHQPMMQQQQQAAFAPPRATPAPARAPAGAAPSLMLADDNEMRAAVAAAGEEVRLLFSGAGLLSFVTDAPDAATLQYVQEMAQRVGAFVALAASGLPPPALVPLSASSSSSAAAASLAAGASEVVSILGFLSHSGRSLKLLELSGICGPVAQLSQVLDDHRVLMRWPPEQQLLLQQVRAQAVALAGLWWDLASAADHVAEAALATPQDGGGGGGADGVGGVAGMMMAMGVQ